MAILTYINVTFQHNCSFSTFIPATVDCRCYLLHILFQTELQTIGQSAQKATSDVLTLIPRQFVSYLLLLLQPLHGDLKLSLLLTGLGDSRLVLLLVCHGDHSQDEVDQVEGAQEDHHHEKHHVGLTGWTQRLQAHTHVTSHHTTDIMVFFMFESWSPVTEAVWTWLQHVSPVKLQQCFMG